VPDRATGEAGRGAPLGEGPGLPAAPPVRRVSAVVVSWNQAHQLPACLAALDAQEGVDLHVVVVDNASRDGSAEVVRAAVGGAPRRHPLQLVVNATNRGFSGGVHDGLAAAAVPHEAVWLVNVDAVPARDHLARLVDALDADPSIGAVQGRLVRSEVGPDGAEVVDSTGVSATRARLFRDRDEGSAVAQAPRPAGEVFGVTGACSLWRTAALEDVRWRDGQILTESLFAYFEDVELAWRLRRFGWRCWHEPAAHATHQRGGAGPRRSAFVEELNAANRLLVVATHEDLRDVGGSLPLVAATTGLKLAELALTVPRAWVPAVRRLSGGWRAARARHGELEDRARVPAVQVRDRWFEAFAWRPWVATWWRRIRGRAPGTASGGRRRG
jgi:GT2 family glycosyltransferase